MTNQNRHNWLLALAYAALVVLALALRLVVWNWRAAYPLGGDEAEYLQQALTLLQQRQYVELNLMRPPLYTLFLAGAIVLFDSVIQNLRLLQEVIGALTVLPVAALTFSITRSQWAALLAGLLIALNYTLAATATELLTETVFLFGLSTVFWLVLQAARSRSLVPAALAGLGLGALVLIRSVALPLVPLGVLWLVAGWRGGKKFPFVLRRIIPGVLFAVCALTVILPWTARNVATYHTLILVDTTGAENLWLDNNPSARTPSDPLGRESAKRALYELGGDRGARQQLASRNGIAEITSHPGWFVQKAWGETTKFFALQYFDELRAKRAIWVPPAEVWAKLLLGDGLWLVLLLAGAAGLVLAPLRQTSDQNDPRWMFIPWVLYILATSALFHVELRYRLPIYPALLPYAVWAMMALAKHRQRPAILWKPIFAGVLVVMLVGMTMLHRNYPAESLMLAQKHIALAQAENALDSGDAAAAQTHANRALALDDESALARVALARAALLRGDHTAANTALDGAINALTAHPYAHLLRGALLRAEGKMAQVEFAYETASLEDLQRWSWQAFAPLGPPPGTLAIGDGLDLGMIRDFYPAEDNARWTKARSDVQLSVPANTRTIELDVASGRPSGLAAPTLIVHANGTEIGRTAVQPGWQTVRIPFQTTESTVVITLQSETFRPRSVDPTSNDNRELGVLVRRVAVLP